MGLAWDDVMATVLLTWELGAGLGHLVNLLPLVQGLSGRGHRVVLALKDLSRVHGFFGEMGVSYLQAPIKMRRVERRFEPLRSFPHILHNSGFGDADQLRVMVDAWRNLFEFARPDLIVFDHSPTALLAAKGVPARKALIGTGFFCPLDVSPLPDLRPWLGDCSSELRQHEDTVLKNANTVLESHGQPPLDRISQLYHPVDENLLVTFRELDHYPGRQGTTYWGAWPNVGGKIPIWPKDKGKRIYAYLKPFPTLPKILGLLNDLGCPTLIYVDGIDAKTQERFRSPTLRFENERLDLHAVGQQCDLAILNGNHGTTVSMLLVGKPTMQLPLFLEQAIFSSSVERLGAGLIAPPPKPGIVARKLNVLLGSEQYTKAARQFATKYADYDPKRQIEKMLNRAEELFA